jgi:predicted Fe-Mo cluster-binding NifX family protein
MKVACITDDGKTISAHFGRARHYAVLTVEDGRIVARELRDKLGHGQFAPQEEHGHDHGAAHGTDPASHDRHVRMAEGISDCEAVLCGGMGRGAYLSMQRLGVSPVVTAETDIDRAVLAYAAGTLADHPEMLH